jgi:outer membrane protein
MQKRRRKLALLYIALLAAEILHTTSLSAQEQEWGVSAVLRRAQVPYAVNAGEDNVSTFIPMLHVDSPHFYIDGMEGGVYLYQPGDSPWYTSALLRLRFMDHPDAGEGAVEENSADFGVQLRYRAADEWMLETELMSDPDSRFHLNLRASAAFDPRNWVIEPSVNLRYKTPAFNSAYFSLSDATGEEIGGGIDIRLALRARYHLFSNLYLQGEAGVTRLDDNAFESAAIKSRYQNEFSFGFGFFHNHNKPYKPELDNRPYLRLAYGWATPSDVEDIFELRSRKDTHNNQLASLFLGYPLTDELFGAPVHLYFTPGIAHHRPSSVQGSSTEFIAAIKGFWHFDWPVKWRFGLAEGLSYIDSVTYIEEAEIVEDGDTPNRLLNYLDFSLDVNVGDLLGVQEWHNIWLGYSMHHRSALFKASSQFGGIKGGSNYNTLYIQYQF